ncbi:MFS transporter [Fictibacillus sp. Mic-4]|uniref:MFS transporter n=1 Tax=Fictibacillus sp. Mic-4 TaxID=3132826 RepID=UPI003CEAB622
MKNGKKLGNLILTKDLLLLLVVGGLFYLSTSLSNTFVNIYLWKQSGNLVDIALYNLSIVVVQPVSFYFAGKLAKRIDRVIIIRIGVTMLSIFYITVLLLNQHADQFMLLLGGLLGLGLGFYWLAFNVLTFEVTEPDTRDFFNGYLGVLSSFSGMIGPLCAGLLISKMNKFTGYNVIFSLSLFLFVAAVLTTFFLGRRKAEGDYCVKEIYKARQVNKNWGRILKAHFLQGMREGVFAFVIIIWVYTASKSEMALGTFSFAQSAVSFVCYYLASRIITPKRRKEAIFLGGLLLFITPFLLLFKLSFPLLMTYGIIVSFAFPILLVPYVSLTYDVIGRSKNAGKMRIEYVVVRELYLNAGRVFSIVVLLFTLLFVKSETAIPVLLPILGAGHFFIYFFVKPIHLSNPKNRNAMEEVAENLADGDGRSNL